MAKLADTAQVAMDLYYQSYKSDEDFFTLKHFMYLCGVVYSKILEEEYTLARREAKAETGFTEIDLQSDWLQEVTVDIKNLNMVNGTADFKLPYRPFSFPYDPYGFGIQAIETISGSCHDYIRTTHKKSWTLKLLPYNDKIFWYVVGQEVRLRNIKGTLGKVRILYIPEVTDPAFGEDGGDLPKSKEQPIIEYVVNLMARARQGIVVDMTNNSNPNKTIQSELDTAFSNLRTKPI